MPSGGRWDDALEKQKRGANRSKRQIDSIARRWERSTTCLPLTQMLKVRFVFSSMTALSRKRNLEFGHHLSDRVATPTAKEVRNVSTLVGVCLGSA